MKRASRSSTRSSPSLAIRLRAPWNRRILQTSDSVIGSSDGAYLYDCRSTTLLPWYRLNSWGKLIAIAFPGASAEKSHRTQEVLYHQRKALKWNPIEPIRTQAGQRSARSLAASVQLSSCEPAKCCAVMQLQPVCRADQAHRCACDAS